MLRIFTFILLLLSTSSAMADVTIHAFGPDNQIKHKLDKCEISETYKTYFDDETKFYTMFERDHNGQCQRIKAYEDDCQPILFLCSTKFYQYKSAPIFLFSKKCPHPSFRNRVFFGRQSQSPGLHTQHPSK
ncbi:MAG: hypothetical protein ACI9TY_000195 [Alphaproteobacteria bacterium]|jgi:hypothetical protein